MHNHVNVYQWISQPQSVYFHDMIQLSSAELSSAFDSTGELN